MSDLDDLGGETPPEPVAEKQPEETVEYWKSRAAEAEKQAVDRRVALRRHEAAERAGVKASDIPDWVPADKLDEFATKFVPTGSTTPNQTEQATPEATVETTPPPAEPAQIESEQRLATVVGQAPGVQSSATNESAKELADLYKSDPAEATRRAIAKYRNDPRVTNPKG